MEDRGKSEEVANVWKMNVKLKERGKKMCKLWRGVIEKLCVFVVNTTIIVIVIVIVADISILIQCRCTVRVRTLPRFSKISCVLTQLMQIKFQKFSNAFPVCNDNDHDESTYIYNSFTYCTYLFTPSMQGHEGN